MFLLLLTMATGKRAYMRRVNRIITGRSRTIGIAAAVAASHPNNVITLSLFPEIEYTRKIFFGNNNVSGLRREASSRLYCYPRAYWTRTLSFGAFDSFVFLVRRPMWLWRFCSRRWTFPFELYRLSNTLEVVVGDSLFRAPRLTSRIKNKRTIPAVVRLFIWIEWFEMPLFSVLQGMRFCYLVLEDPLNNGFVLGTEYKLIMCRID